MTLHRNENAQQRATLRQRGHPGGRRGQPAPLSRKSIELNLSAAGSALRRCFSMTPRKSKKHAEPEALCFPTMSAASGATGIPLRILRQWKAAGSPGFDPSGRVYLRPALEWAFTRHPEEALPEGATSWREALLRAQARRQELRLERERGEVVSRAWVAQAIMRMGGELESFRLKSEAEHPLLFTAAGGDVPKCRAIVRRIWDDIMGAIHGLAHHLEHTNEPQG